MTEIARLLKRLAGCLALVTMASIAGTAVSVLVTPAPAVAHPCSTSECNSFLIFWERCEDNPGQTTYCDPNSDTEGGGCTTRGCGHK